MGGLLSKFRKGGSRGEQGRTEPATTEPSRPEATSADPGRIEVSPAESGQPEPTQSRQIAHSQSHGDFAASQDSPLSREHRSEPHLLDDERGPPYKSDTLRSTKSEGGKRSGFKKSSSKSDTLKSGTSSKNGSGNLKNEEGRASRGGTLTKGGTLKGLFKGSGSKSATLKSTKSTDSRSSDSLDRKQRREGGRDSSTEDLGGNFFTRLFRRSTRDRRRKKKENKRAKSEEKAELLGVQAEHSRSKDDHEVVLYSAEGGAISYGHQTSTDIPKDGAVDPTRYNDIDGDADVSKPSETPLLDTLKFDAYEISTRPAQSDDRPASWDPQEQEIRNLKEALSRSQELILEHQEKRREFLATKTIITTGTKTEFDTHWRQDGSDDVQNVKIQSTEELVWSSNVSNARTDSTDGDPLRQSGPESRTTSGDWMFGQTPIVQETSSENATQRVATDDQFEENRTDNILMRVTYEHETKRNTDDLDVRIPSQEVTEEQIRQDGFEAVGVDVPLHAGFISAAAPDIKREPYKQRFSSDDTEELSGEYRGDSDMKDADIDDFMQKRQQDSHEDTLELSGGFQDQVVGTKDVNKLGFDDNYIDLVTCQEQISKEKQVTSTAVADKAPDDDSWEIIDDGTIPSAEAGAQSAINDGIDTTEEMKHKGSFSEEGSVSQEDNKDLDLVKEFEARQKDFQNETWERVEKRIGSAVEESSKLEERVTMGSQISRESDMSDTRSETLSDPFVDQESTGVDKKHSVRAVDIKFGWKEHTQESQRDQKHDDFDDISGERVFESISPESNMGNDQQVSLNKEAATVPEVVDEDAIVYTKSEFAPSEPAHTLSHFESEGRSDIFSDDRYIIYEDSSMSESRPSTIPEEPSDMDLRERLESFNEATALDQFTSSQPRGALEFENSQLSGQKSESPTWSRGDIMRTPHTLTYEETSSYEIPDETDIHHEEEAARDMAPSSPFMHEDDVKQKPDFDFEDTELSPSMSRDFVEDSDLKELDGQAVVKSDTFTKEIDVGYSQHISNGERDMEQDSQQEYGEHVKEEQLESPDENLFSQQSTGNLEQGRNHEMNTSMNGEPLHADEKYPNISAFRTTDIPEINIDDGEERCSISPTTEAEVPIHAMEYIPDEMKSDPDTADQLGDSHEGEISIEDELTPDKEISIDFHTKAGDEPFDESRELKKMEDFDMDADKIASESQNIIDHSTEDYPDVESREYGSAESESRDFRPDAREDYGVDIPILQDKKTSESDLLSSVESAKRDYDGMIEQQEKTCTNVEDISDRNIPIDDDKKIISDDMDLDFSMEPENVDDRSIDQPWGIDETCTQEVEKVDESGSTKGDEAVNALIEEVVSDSQVIDKTIASKQDEDSFEVGSPDVPIVQDVDQESRDLAKKEELSDSYSDDICVDQSSRMEADEATNVEAPETGAFSQEFDEKSFAVGSPDVPAVQDVQDVDRDVDLIKEKELIDSYSDDMRVDQSSHTEADEATKVEAPETAAFRQEFDEESFEVGSPAVPIIQDVQDMDQESRDLTKKGELIDIYSDDMRVDQSSHMEADEATKVEAPETGAFPQEFDEESFEVGSPAVPIVQDVQDVNQESRDLTKRDELIDSYSNGMCVDQSSHTDADEATKVEVPEAGAFRHEFDEDSFEVGSPDAPIVQDVQDTDPENRDLVTRELDDSYSNDMNVDQSCHTKTDEAIEVEATKTGAFSQELWTSDQPPLIKRDDIEATPESAGCEEPTCTEEDRLGDVDSQKDVPITLFKDSWTEKGFDQKPEGLIDIAMPVFEPDVEDMDEDRHISTSEEIIDTCSERDSKHELMLEGESVQDIVRVDVDSSDEAIIHGADNLDQPNFTESGEGSVDITSANDKDIEDENNSQDDERFDGPTYKEADDDSYIKSPADDEVTGDQLNLNNLDQPSYKEAGDDTVDILSFNDATLAEDTSVEMTTAAAYTDTPDQDTVPEGRQPISQVEDIMKESNTTEGDDAVVQESLDRPAVDIDSSNDDTTTQITDELPHDGVVDGYGVIQDDMSLVQPGRNEVADDTVIIASPDDEDVMHGTHSTDQQWFADKDETAVQDVVNLNQSSLIEETPVTQDVDSVDQPIDSENDIDVTSKETVECNTHDALSVDVPMYKESSDDIVDVSSQNDEGGIQDADSFERPNPIGREDDMVQDIDTLDDDDIGNHTNKDEECVAFESPNDATITEDVNLNEPTVHDNYEVSEQDTTDIVQASHDEEDHETLMRSEAIITEDVENLDKLDYSEEDGVISRESEPIDRTNLPELNFGPTEHETGDFQQAMYPGEDETNYDMNIPHGDAMQESSYKSTEGSEETDALLSVDGDVTASELKTVGNEDTAEQTDVNDTPAGNDDLLADEQLENLDRPSYTIDAGMKDILIDTQAEQEFKRLPELTENDDSPIFTQEDGTDMFTLDTQAQSPKYSSENRDIPGYITQDVVNVTIDKQDEHTAKQMEEVELNLDMPSYQTQEVELGLIDTQLTAPKDAPEESETLEQKNMDEPEYVLRKYEQVAVGAINSDEHFPPQQKSTTLEENAWSEADSMEQASTNKDEASVPSGETTFDVSREASSKDSECYDNGVRDTLPSYGLHFEFRDEVNDQTEILPTSLLCDLTPSNEGMGQETTNIDPDSSLDDAPQLSEPDLRQFPAEYPSEDIHQQEEIRQDVSELHSESTSELLEGQLEDRNQIMGKINDSIEHSPTEEPEKNPFEQQLSDDSFWQAIQASATSLSDAFRETDISQPDSSVDGLKDESYHLDDHSMDATKKQSEVNAPYSEEKDTDTSLRERSSTPESKIQADQTEKSLENDNEATGDNIRDGVTTPMESTPPQLDRDDDPYLEQIGYAAATTDDDLQSKQEYSYEDFEKPSLVRQPSVKDMEEWANLTEKEETPTEQEIPLNLSIPEKGLEGSHDESPESQDSTLVDVAEDFEELTESGDMHRPDSDPVTKETEQAGYQNSQRHIERDSDWAQDDWELAFGSTLTNSQDPDKREKCLDEQSSKSPEEDQYKGADDDHQLYVVQEFVWEHGGHTVSVSGSFSDWEDIPMSNSGGVFKLTMRLPEGRHYYRYRVDGDTMANPIEDMEGDVNYVEIRKF